MSGRVVAVVDDDSSLLEATVEFLESVGYATVCFDSAASFLLHPTIAQVGCLLTDVQMPGMNGLELQDRVRVEHPLIAVIMMSACVDEQTRRRAMAGGACAFLGKPLPADEVLRLLEASIGAPDPSGTP